MSVHHIPLCAYASMFVYSDVYSVNNLFSFAVKLVLVTIDINGYLLLFIEISNEHNESILALWLRYVKFVKITLISERFVFHFVERRRC